MPWLNKRGVIGGHQYRLPAGQSINGCPPIIHYGFTHEELDFIINYDIKYRMGKELDNENEDK